MSIKLSYAVALSDKDFKKSFGSWKVTNPAFKNKAGMIAFMAGWCGHCQRLKPNYDRVAALTMPEYPIGYVDAVAHPGLADAVGVQGYPTIFMVNEQGTLSGTYQGDRSTNGFINYICTSGMQGNKSFCTRR